ncbi:hypothetical protein OSTOST_07854, partial [Ostertagia ostertagi]
ITYCTESCGGWGCSCGFPSSGCLFYRIYHVPTGNDVHEVFQCSSWYETVKLKLEQLDTKQIQRTFTGEIKPYEERTFGNTKVEVTNFALSPNTIQYKRFISNNRTTAYLDDDVTFSYACTSNPAIFNTPTQCSIRDTCKCNPAEDSILCYCAQNNISQVYHLSHMLPLPIPNGIIVAGPKRIPKIHTKSFSIELAIKLDSTVLQIQREAIEFKCNVAATALSGCYNCYKGAVATIDCSADTPRATAQATCGHQQFVLTCTREGKENQIRLFSTKRADGNQDEAIQAMEEVEEEIPVEPGNGKPLVATKTSVPPEQEPQRPPRVEYRALDEPRVPPEADELSAVHRKVNRILGRSEDIQPMKNRLGSVSTLLHAIDQRTTTMKAVVDRTMVGLEQVYNQQKDILKELGEQKDILKNLAAAPPRRRSPQPGPSHQVDGSNSQQLKCALCDGNHHACDCKRFRTLSDRKRRLDERKSYQFQLIRFFSLQLSNLLQISISYLI